jgi:hypothetical protein
MPKYAKNNYLCLFWCMINNLLCNTHGMNVTVLVSNIFFNQYVNAIFNLSFKSYLGLRLYTLR